MEKFYKIFNEYAKQFDLNDKNILYKFHHSYRVMEFAKEIAISLNLDEKDIEIALLCGLFHDIARFEQWTKYGTYIDRKSVDHGDLGYEILIKDDFIKKITEDEKTIEIILNSTKYHNKKEIPLLDDRNTLFLKITRDADKLDIMKELKTPIDDDIVLNEEMLKEIYQKKICGNECIKGKTDVILRMLAWVFDLNFKYSFEYLINNEILKHKFDLLEMYGETEEIKKLKDFIYEEAYKYVR